MKPQYKKNFASAAVALFLLVIATCGFVLFAAASGQDYDRIVFEKSYYFLIKDTEEATATAVAGDVYSAGGAGYFLEGENAVAIACYFKQSSAESVKKDLQENGTETRLVVKTPASLTLRGSKSAYKAQIQSNLTTVDNFAHVLYETANGLERGELSQREARAALEGVVSSLKGLIEKNDVRIFTLWNLALKEGERKGTELCKGLLFSRDLRYLQTLLCDKAVNLANYFS